MTSVELEGESSPTRVTAAFSRLLDLSGIWVRTVVFMPDRVVVHVALRRKKLQCPKCSYSTMARENERDHDSVGRHLEKAPDKPA